jgi:hypothetical protein
VYFKSEHGYDIRLEEVGAYYKSELQTDLKGRKGVPGQDGGEPLLKNMTAKRLRRRYSRGERVLLYQGVDEGFVEAVVVKQEAEHEPGMENVTAASPKLSKTSSDDESAQMKAGRYNCGDQRHAIVVVRRIRSGSALPQEKMKVPEYALRRLVASGSEDAPLRPSSPSSIWAPKDPTKDSPHAEGAFELGNVAGKGCIDV